MKKSLRIIVYFFFFISTFCDVIALIGPVIPGQSLWCINKRMASEIDNIESKLDNLCHPTMITGPGTISQEGAYCLGNTIVGSLTINASNVDLDMSNRRVTQGITVASDVDRVSIHNGTVQGSPNALTVNTGVTNLTLDDVTAKNSTRGISLTGVTDALINNCEMVLNTIGLELTSCQKVTVNNCIAANNTSTGYSLISSSTSTFENCKALGTGTGNAGITNTNVFGFVSQNGVSNIFERCIANATQALSTTDQNSVIAGFAFRGTESCSKIIDSEAANSITASSGLTIPYGILLESRFDSVTTATAITLNLVNDTVFLSLSWSPDGQYVVVAAPFNQNLSTGIRVYKFDRDKQLLVLMDAFASVISEASATDLQVQWSPSGMFIAATGAFNETQGLFIFRFDRESEKLVLITSGGPADNDRVPLAWSPDEKYIVMGESTANISLRLFRFDSVAETVTQVFTLQVGGDPNAQVASYSWSPDGNYLAVGAATNTNDLFVYRFNRSAQTFTQVDAVNPDGGSAGDTVQAVTWSPNGQYLAAGGAISGVTNNDLFLYRFSRTTETLTQVDSVNPSGGGTSDQIFALSWSPDSNYLAAAGFVGTTVDNDFFVYSFNRATEKLIQFASINLDGGSANDFVTAVDWSPDGGYIAVGGQTANDPSTNNFYILNGIQFPFKNVIKSNTVYCNSGGSIPGGVGISGSNICNYIVDNTAYSNPINPPIIGSNYQFVCNVFYQVFGSFPSELQNISIGTCEPIFNPDNTNLLIKQNLSKTIDIQSKVDMLALCAPQPLTAEDIVGGVITLDEPGCYCLSSDLTTDIVITASCVCLDLTERCLRGVISISAADDIIVKNGFVNPAAPTTEPPAAGITIDAAANGVMLDKITIDCADTTVVDVSGRTGISSAGNDVQIINCTVKSGSASTTAGTGVAGGDGIVIASDATRALVKNCVVLATGNGAPGTAGVNGGRAGDGIAVGLSGVPAFTEILECIVFSTGNGGNGGTGVTTGGDGGHAVSIGETAVDTSVRNCTLRNTGTGGTGGSASGENGRAVNDLVTTVGNLSMIFSNFAHNIANAVKYNIQSTGLESGVLTPNPPTSTVINPLANVYAS